jgi:hypothetical protein
MALIIGDQTADTGMSKAIYDQLQSVLEPALEGLSEEARSRLRESWKKLAYAIARGVIEHIMTNMEVVGIQTQGNVSAPVQGNTSLVSGHQHGVNLTGEQNNLVFTQSNDGTGHIK